MKIRYPGHRQPTALFLAIAAALALVPAGTVLAQSTATAQQAVPEEDTSERQTRTLGTVVVTANKRLENVRDVPASISVVGEAELENLGATQLTDFAGYVPGMQVTSGGTPGQVAISLRGISPISPGANIGTYIDEAPVGSSGLYQRQTAFAMDLLPYDISRVEVLRGPQGTLYGAGAMGGLLKYVTRDPDLAATEFRVGAGLASVKNGDSNGWGARLGANVPLVADRLAIRASYARNEIPGYIDNVRSGQRGVNEATQESARVALLWQPSDAVSLKLSAMRQSIDSEDNATVSLAADTLRPLFGDLTNNHAVREPFTKDIDFYSGTLDWDLGWGDFVSATSYSEVDTTQRADATIEFGEFPLLLGLPAGISFFDLGLGLEKFTQEFRLTSRDTGRFNWQVGAFYTTEDTTNTQVIRLQALDGSSIPGFDPLAIVGLPSDYKETALFANGSFDFTDRFELGAGVRFARNDQTFAQVVEPGSPLLPAGVTPGGSKEDVFTWHLSPKLELGEDSMLYARIATGYQPGGPNAAVPNVPPTVDASTTTNYELGLKSEFSDRRVQLDLALFRIDWQDIQVAASVGGVTYLTNGGEAVSQGAEMTLAFRPTDHLELGFNAAYTDATLSNDTPLVNGFRTGLEGDRLPLIPQLSWAGTADYDFDLGGHWTGRVGAGLRWVGDRESALTNTRPDAPPTPRLDSYPTLDLNAGISNDHWSLRGYIKNVTDERAYQSIGASQSQVTGVVAQMLATPILPRTFGLEIDYRF